MNTPRVAAEGTGRAALVTGAARGLGEGIARRLAKDGWSVLMADADSRVGETASALGAALELPPGRLLPRVTDVADVIQIDSAVQAAVDRFAGLDLAVANAGIGGVETDLVDLEPSDFDAIVAVNLRGVYLTCRAAARVMRTVRQGSIVTISSIVGQDPLPRAAAYSATKAGVIALTQALALELAPYGVRANGIAPGYMATEMQWAGLRARAAHSGVSFEAERERVVAMLPLARHGTPDDVGAAVAFLASADAAYITGHTLGVHGGIIRR